MGRGNTPGGPIKQRDRTMRQHTLRTGLGLLAALVMVMPAAATAVESAPAAATSADHNASSGSKPVLTEDALVAGRATYGSRATTQQALQAYWTPARMKAAKPVASDPAFAKAVRDFEARSAKERRSGNETASQDGPARTVKAAGTSSVRTTTAFAGFTERTSGKVFFTKPGVGNFVCSGTVVNSAGLDAVWTAGHCVHGGDGGTWATNWVFVPDYDNGSRPYGTWSARQLWSKGDWINDSDFDEDMGVAIMNPLSGTHIVNRVGGQGFTVNQGKRVYEVAFGYAAEAPFNGQTLRSCAGTSSPEWDVWFAWSHTLKIPCNLTRGSSGGAWFKSYSSSSGTGYLNGVNSRIDRIVGPTIMLSPYFDDSAWSLYTATKDL